MAECINCENQAFETVGDDAVLVNIVSDDLDISQNDTLRSAFYKVVAKLEELMAQKTASAGVPEIGTIENTAPQKSKSASTLSLQVSPALSSTKISYDISDVVGSSAKAYTKVEAFGNGVKVYEGNNRAAAFEVAPESFPLTLNITSNTLSSNGQVKYSFEKTISNQSSLTDEFMDVTDLSSTSVVEQKDVNELFDKQIGSLLNRVNALEKG